MLTGEGGILKQAGEARERTGRANIIEQARVDLLEKQTENKGKVSKEDLQDGSSSDYRGVLYNWRENSSGKTEYEWSSTTGFREPDIVSSYDTEEKGYLSKIGLTPEQFKQEMQDNCNAMIKSVQTYGRFYVGRYETSGIK